MATSTFASKAAPSWMTATMTPRPPARPRALLPSNRQLLKLQRHCSCGGTCEECKKVGNLQTSSVDRSEDPLEREADNIADRVMRSEFGPFPVSALPPDGVTSNPEFSADALAQVRSVVSSTGRGLDPGTRAFMEPRFGMDLGHVRVHSGSAAERSADAVGARAYALGSNIVLGKPGASGSTRLLAHEIAHTLQQQNGSPRLARKCGTEIGAKPAQCEIDSASPGGTRFFFKVNCDDFRQGEEARLKSFTKDPGSIPAGSEIEIVGIASSDGPPSFNEALACSRAEKVRQAVAVNHASKLKRIRATGGIGRHGDSNNRAVAISTRQPGGIPPAPAPSGPDTQCTPAPGIPSSDCSIYGSNAWWLPTAYVQNATCACLVTPNEPKANCVRKFLQDRLRAYPSWEKSLLAASKIGDYAEYQAVVQAVLTPQIYKDHVDAYAACCCPCPPASYEKWIGVTSVPLPCSFVKTAIFEKGPCNCKPGLW